MSEGKMSHEYLHGWYLNALKGWIEGKKNQYDNEKADKQAIIDTATMSTNAYLTTREMLQSFRENYLRGKQRDFGIESLTSEDPGYGETWEWDSPEGGLEKFWEKSLQNAFGVQPDINLLDYNKDGTIDDKDRLDFKAKSDKEYQGIAKTKSGVIDELNVKYSEDDELTDGLTNVELDSGFDAGGVSEDLYEGQTNLDLDSGFDAGNVSEEFILPDSEEISIELPEGKRIDHIEPNGEEMSAALMATNDLGRQAKTFSELLEDDKLKKLRLGGII